MRRKTEEILDFYFRQKSSKDNKKNGGKKTDKQREQRKTKNNEEAKTLQHHLHQTHRELPPLLALVLCRCVLGTR